ncbi:neurotensin/neuromedin N [Arapaima gigas]
MGRTVKAASFLILVSGQNMANWRVMLLNFCGLLHSQREENINKEAPALEGLYSIHSLCWTLHPTRRNDQSASGYLDLQYAENNKNVLKKKSPYILKRHLYAGKARRPYILKRSLDY